MWSAFFLTLWVFEYVCVEYIMRYCFCRYLAVADCSQLERSIWKKHSHHRNQQARTSIIIMATYQVVTSQWGKFVAIDCHEWSPAACSNDYTLQILWNQCVLCVLAEMNYRFIKDYLWASQTLWRWSIFLQQKSFQNKRFVLLQVDRNSTEPCKFPQHRTLWRICSWVTQEMNV